MQMQIREANIGAKSFKWDRKNRVAFASLLVVKLPATYTFPENTQKIEGWRVRQRPQLHSKAIGTLRVGQRFEATERKGLWLKVDLPNSKKKGWALAEIDGVQYIRPVFPQVIYPWQRARGSGLMYEDVLSKRREELRNMDLAKDPRLVNEWMALIGELDAVLRLTRGFARLIKQAKSTVGNFALNASVRRPRSNSFSMARKGAAPVMMPSEGKHLGDNQRKPRANSFNQKASADADNELDDDNLKDQWATWREDHDERQRQNPFGDGRQNPFNDGAQPQQRQRLNSAEENSRLLSLAKAEAQARIDKEIKHSQNLTKLETASRLNSRQQDMNMSSDRDQMAGRPRSNTLTDILPANEPDVSELYKWSWEKRGQLDPRDFAVDALLKHEVDVRRRIELDDPDDVYANDGEIHDDLDHNGEHYPQHAHDRIRSEESPRSPQQQQMIHMDNKNGLKFSPSLSPRGRQRQPTSPREVATSQLSKSKRSSSLPCRKADGARHNLYIPAGAR